MSAVRKRDGEAAREPFGIPSMYFYVRRPPANAANGTTLMPSRAATGRRSSTQRLNMLYAGRWNSGSMNPFCSQTRIASLVRSGPYVQIPQ